MVLDVKVSLTRGVFKLRAEIHDEGTICLSGPNGSGKSSLMNVIAGNVRPDQGHVKVNQSDITDFPVERRGVVLVTPDSFIPHLEVDKHLSWGARAKKLMVDESSLQEVKKLLGIDFVGRVDELSLGMRERVSLATALLSRPRLLLVDEAFSNIDERETVMRNFLDICSNRKVDLVHTTQQKADAVLLDHHYEISGGLTSKVF
jgi:molybdate/tungstate transport system ATP-binding protein